MTLEHLSNTQLAGYLERSLEPEELLAVDRHLASCDPCYQLLIRLAPGKSFSFEPNEEPFHLDYEEHLEPYVDGKSDDIEREIVDSHVAFCSKCAADLNDLREFKQQPVAAIAGTSTGWRQWLPQLPLRWVAASAAGGGVVLAGGVFLWTRQPASELFQQVKTVSPEASPSATENNAPNTPSPVPEMDKFADEPLLVLNDAGGQVTVNKGGSIEGLRELPPDLKESVERALTTHRLGVSPALKGWSIDTYNLRSGETTQSTFAPLAPVNVVIETDRPTFRWRPLEGSQHCIVTIFDAKLRQVGSSGPMTRAEWTTPNPLPRGVTYSWQITTVKDGETIVTPKPPLPEARFRVLDQRAADALAKLRASAGSSHLALGVFYWKHGLIEESEREFQALAAANPNSPVVKELLASIRAHRHK